ncbi:hypothetical protein [Caballeronia sp. SBC2]|uniref:hypothetical protein n=1 Tax=Caballeronia sp. SBC2 TaxID=2705547 RepID=UPI0013EE2BB1|nr:hypothetical protein [Caballeronia sp. SBC2]
MAVNLSGGSLREEAIIIPQQKSVVLIGKARCAAPVRWPDAHSTLQHNDYDRYGAEVSPLLAVGFATKGGRYPSVDKRIVGFGIRFDFVRRRLIEGCRC